MALGSGYTHGRLSPSGKIKPRDKTATELVKKACKANSHVPAALAGTKKVKSSTSGYITMGGEDEAAHYVQEWGFDWLTTPGAVDWLTKLRLKWRQRQRNGDLCIDDGAAADRRSMAGMGGLAVTSSAM